MGYNGGADVDDGKMWQYSELNRGTRILKKKGCDTKMQSTYFEHKMRDVTARPIN